MPATRPTPVLSLIALMPTSTTEMSEVSPATTRDPKNRSPSRTPAGASLRIAGKATKARPIPSATTSPTGWPVFVARKPRTAKTPMPANSSKPELENATTEPEPVRSVLRPT